MGIEKLQNTISKDSGFSLIELLIAMSVIAIGMLAAASMQYSAVRNNTTRQYLHPGHHAGESHAGDA